MEKPIPTKRSFFASIFLSPSERRLRAGWRLLIQTLLMLVLVMCIGLVLIIILNVIGAWGIGELLVLEIIELIAITISIFLARRFLDKRSFGSLGLSLNRNALWDLLAGILIAGLIMGFIYLLEWSFGWLTFEGYAWEFEPPAWVPINVIIVLLLFIIVGWSEELLFRGYYLQNLSDGLNPVWGVILSSVFFSSLHLLNPNASWMSLAGIILAGLFLASGYLLTKQLWLPIGLHIGWNFFEGVVFGFPVSGMSFYNLTRITINGPPWLTGGEFGPEAGLMLLPALMMGAILLYVYAHEVRAPGAKR